MSFVESLFGLVGRVALVTGGNSGLGLAMAKALALGGARVVICGRNAQRLQTAVEDVGNSGSQAACVEFDVELTAKLPELAHLAARPFGPPDILVNAAGVNPRFPWDQVDVAMWEKTLAVNLNAAFFLAKELVGSMIKRGFGRIINLSSLQSVRAFENSMPYGASKGGISQLTRAMAEAWSKGQSGVTVNAVAPGFFKTKLTEPLFEQPELVQSLASKTLIGRTGEPEDIHGITLFLASKASSYVTGQVVLLDGGWTAA